MKTADPHPIELALLALRLGAEAITVLIAALLALVLSLASWRPTPTPTAPTPLQHPLTLLAAELVALPHRELMQLAGTRRRLAKHRLTELVLVG
jgi:hypothetical protein